MSKNNKIIGIIIITLLLLTGCIGKKSFNGYTAGVGEDLKINEVIYHFNVKALSAVEKYTITNSFLYDGDHARLKVNVENKDKDALALSIVGFALTDANKTDIAKGEIFFKDRAFLQMIFHLNLLKKDIFILIIN